MFKNSKLSSDTQMKKETLEQLGYGFASITKKSGWNWSTEKDASDGNFPSEGDAVQDAWRDAGIQAQDLLAIPSDTWERMGAKEQKEMILDALTGEE